VRELVDGLGRPQWVDSRRQALNVCGGWKADLRQAIPVRRGALWTL
jgi:hypothetical protein